MEEFKEFLGKIVYVQQTNGEVNIGKLVEEKDTFIKIMSEHHTYYISKNAIAKIWVKGGLGNE